MSTPMFEQFHALKAKAPDAILLFRMGDFYETFFEDAVIAAKELELTLTSRDKASENPVPMAGVPYHAAEPYVRRLVEAGYRVAIAEQMEDPALAKGIVRREIVRVVTPAVALDPTALDAKEPCWLFGLCRNERGYGAAFLDLSTGAVKATAVDHPSAVVAELGRLEPCEAVIEPGIDEELLLATLKRRGVLKSRVPDEAWAPLEAERELCLATKVRDPSEAGLDRRHPALRAVGALLRYARETSGGPLRNVHRVETYEVKGFLVLDETTRRNLELHRTMLGGRRQGSLLGLLDRCATAMGSRRLKDWVAFPLLDPVAIRARSAAVEAFEAPIRERLQEHLASVADIERIGARVAQSTANARDLAALRRSLLAAPSAVEGLDAVPELAPHVPTDLCGDVAAELVRWLVEDPPIQLGEGGIIAPGAHPELDRLTRLAVEGVGDISALEERERRRTGISSLKIRRAQNTGYFIELTKAQQHRAPSNYLRRQTLTNSERFVTPELKELEELVLGADEKRKRLELELFTALRERVAQASPRLLALAGKLADLDVLATLSDLAARYRWVRPEVDESTVLDVIGGRHPVVEAFLDEERFVPNDLFLDTETRQLVVLTGPNMAGKSTVLRQTALVALLAQIGSFVPAERARVGVCDRIFTRVGAADDLARGQSTFMVEMAETAAILHHATPRSLVVLDEIGRGTSTYDGLSIAWAVAEDLVDRVRCRALFATHYHELCELAGTRERVANLSVAVSESGERIVFLRRLKEGGTSRSYGVQCARLAGLPEGVLKRARQLLGRFEKHAPKNAQHQMSLFGSVRAYEPEPEPQADPLRDALRAVDPDALSPREALEALYRLRALL